MRRNLKFIKFLMQQISKEIKSVSGKCSTHFNRQLKHVSIYIIVCCMLVSMFPTTIHGEDIVPVTTADELKAAIEAAPDNMETVIYIEGNVVLPTTGPTMSMELENKNIHIKGINSEAAIASSNYSPFVLENSALTLDSIQITNTTSKYGEATIEINGNSTLNMNQGSVLNGMKRDRILIGGMDNQIIMNNGSRINVDNGADGFTGGSATVTLHTGSLIQGDKKSGNAIYLEGNNNHIIIDGGEIVDTRQGIGLDGNNNTLELKSGSIRGNTYAGVYVGGSGAVNTVVMQDGMVIEDNHYAGVNLGSNSKFTMNGGVIQNNTNDASGSGGGITVGGNAQVIIHNGSILSNSASSKGGGIYAEGASEGKASVIIHRALIQGNTSSNGGGIYIHNKASLTLYDADISKNSATSDGGGIYQYNGGKVELLGGNIHENSAEIAGGMEVSDDNVFLQGNVQIQNNTKTSGETSNLYIRPAYSNLQIAGALTGKIGITHKFAAVDKKFAKASGDYLITDADANALQYDGDYGTILSDDKKSLSLGAVAGDVSITKDIDEKLKMVAIKDKSTYEIEAKSSDGNKLRYEWYVNTTPSYDGATLLESTSKNKYDVNFDKAGTYYVFVKAINEFNHTQKEANSKFAHLSVYEKKEDSGSIFGSIENDDPAGDNRDVTIEIYRKDELIGKTTSDAFGNFSFNNLPYGVYNLIAQKGEQKITMKIDVNAQQMNASVRLPMGNKNTVVESIGVTTPAVVVQGLNELYKEPVKDANKGITAEDLNILKKGGTIELRLIAEQKDKKDIEKDAEKLDAIAKENKKEIAMYLDLSIKKTIQDGIDTKVLNLKEVGKNLEITIELNEDVLARKNLKVYRIHEGDVSGLPQDKGDEYFKVQGKYLIIYARKYSIYALGYDKEETKPVVPEEPDLPVDKPEGNVPPIEGVPGNGTTGTTTSKQPSLINTGDMSGTFSGSSFAFMSSLGVMAVAYHRMKREYIRDHENDCFHGIHNKLKFATFLCKQAIKDGTRYLKERLFPTGN